MASAQPLMKSHSVAPHAKGNNKFDSCAVVQDTVVMVPSWANHVVTYNTRTHELRAYDVTPHEEEVMFKFHACAAVQDIVVMVPYSAGNMVTYNARTHELRSYDFTPYARGSWKFYSCAVVQDLVVIVPALADNVVTYNARTHELCAYDVTPHAQGGDKFQACAVVEDIVVMVPCCADNVVTYNVCTHELRAYDVTPYATDGWKFYSCGVVQDTVVMVPYCADSVVTYNARTHEFRAYDVTPYAQGEFKFYTCAVVQDTVVMAPNLGGNVVTYNARTQKLRAHDVTPHTRGAGKFHSCAVVQDMVVMVPTDGDYVVTYNPRTHEMRAYDVTPHAKGNGKFLSCAVVQDMVVMVPNCADNVVTFEPSPPPVAVAPAPAPTGGVVAGQRRAGRKRWAQGIEAPAVGGSRAFFPAGWVVDCTVGEAIAHARVPPESVETLGQLAAEKHAALADRAILAVTPTRDQILAIMAYTDEDAGLYGSLNECMRTPGVEAASILERYLAFMHHLTSSLGVLPTYAGKAYRAVDIKLAPELYWVGQVVTWQNFTSATREPIQLLSSLEGHGGSLSGSIFVVDVVTGKDISMFSVFEDEAEVLIGLNSFYKVTAVVTDDAAAKGSLVPQLAGHRLDDVDVYTLEQLG